MEVRKGTFYIGESSEVEGFTLGNTWNGWAMPLLRFENMFSLQWILGEDYTMTYDPPTYTFKAIDNDNPANEIVMRPTLHRFEGKLVELYDVSNGWTWEENDEFKKVFLTNKN